MLPSDLMKNKRSLGISAMRDDSESSLSHSVHELFDLSVGFDTTAKPGTTVLRTVILMGSARDKAPAWGGDARLGERVLRYVVKTMDHRSSLVGRSALRVQHDVKVFDPVNVFGPGGALESSGCEVRTPHFLLKESEVPPLMEAMRSVLQQADCLIVVTPEYNHSVPPAVLSMIAHFNRPTFMAKCSGIVAYSTSPWGGAHAAGAIVPVLHDVGALPVSNMTILGDPASMLDTDGAPIEPKCKALDQLPAMLDQLEWTALAFKKQKEATGLWEGWYTAPVSYSHDINN